MSHVRIIRSVEDVERRRALNGAYQQVLDAVPWRDERGTAETPRRAADALMEMTGGYTVDIPALFTTFPSDGYDEMIVVDNIPFASLCEHHILPFTGKTHVVYIPNGKVIGLSKIPRLVDAFAKRLQIQERLTQQIADALQEFLDPHGVMVVVEAEHTCATLRGVKKPGTMMRTSALKGALMEKPEARAEALSLIGAIR